MSRTPAEVSDTGIGCHVSQQQSLATNSLATFQMTPREIRMKQCALIEALDTE
jgi:hypothetical protein